MELQANEEYHVPLIPPEPEEFDVAGELDRFVTQRIAQATSDNVHDTTEDLPPDTTYTREWARFTQWITQERIGGRVRLGMKFLTRENVDLYFSEIVAKKMVVPESARRVVSALQKYADLDEHVHGAKFKVESRAVLQALTAQKARYGIHIAEQYTDPHANLPTAVLTQEEYALICNKIYKRRDDWADFQWTFNVCDAAFLRFASTQKLFLSDIKCDIAHGPPKDSGIGGRCMMSYALRGGGAHKNSQSKTTMVGAWRHRHWYRCSTSALAFNFMVRFRFAEWTSINFLKPEAGKPIWQKVNIHREWSTKPRKKGYDKANRAYSQVFRSLNIRWSKVTHLRKSGMDHAGTLGVTDEDTGSMSKHITRKQTRYMPQLKDTVLNVMAGFRPDELYDVPRTLIVPPWSSEEMTRAIFPEHDNWCTQAQGRDGDKSEACQDFLGRTIPFLAIVAVQDGIYFIHLFPNHEVSLMLKNRIQGYEVWARQARRQVTERLDNRENSRVDELNNAVQNSYTLLRRGMEGFRDEFNDFRVEVRATLNRLPVHQQQAIPAPARAARPLPVPVRQIINNTPIRVPMVQDVLQNTPRAPPVPRAMAKTFVQLLTQHRNLELESFADDRHSAWPHNVQQAYSRRQYIYSRIKERARNFAGERTPEQKMTHAAEAYDEERAGKTLTQFTSQNLIPNDPKIKKRKRPQQRQN